MSKRIYVDESLFGLGKVLAQARSDVVHPGHRDLPTVQPGDLDEQWIPIVAAAGLVAVVRDKHVVSRWWENELILTHKLRLIHLAVKRDLNNWGYLELFVRHWKTIDLHISNAADGPWRLRVLEQRTQLEPVREAQRSGPRPAKVARAGRPSAIRAAHSRP